MIKTQPIIKFFDHVQTSNIFTNLIVDTCGVQQGYICRAHLFLQESSPLGKLFSRKAAHLENFVSARECNKRAPSGKLQKKNMISKNEDECKKALALLICSLFARNVWPNFGTTHMKHGKIKKHHRSMASLVPQPTYC